MVIIVRMVSRPSISVYQLFAAAETESAFYLFMVPHSGVVGVEHCPDGVVGHGLAIAVDRFVVGGCHV